MTTCTTVLQLTEALTRFNLEARLSPTLEIGGISPATECRIYTAYNDTDQAKVRQMGSELEKLRSKIVAIDAALREAEPANPEVVILAETIKAILV
jgi:hypothetical protein